jgi:hypothetical protein
MVVLELDPDGVQAFIAFITRRSTCGDLTILPRSIGRTNLLRSSSVHISLPGSGSTPHQHSKSPHFDGSVFVQVRAPPTSIAVERCLNGSLRYYYSPRTAWKVLVRDQFYPYPSGRPLSTIACRRFKRLNLDAFFVM